MMFQTHLSVILSLKSNDPKFYSPITKPTFVDVELKKDVTFPGANFRLVLVIRLNALCHVRRS
jgi:hypothetical protein